MSIWDCLIVLKGISICVLIKGTEPDLTSMQYVYVVAVVNEQPSASLCLTMLFLLLFTTLFILAAPEPLKHFLLSHRMV